MNNVSSNLSNVIHCVSQGSVLGPLFFILYVNDLSNAVPDNQLKLFADDINLFIFAPDMSELKANNYLKTMDSWVLANKLSLNINKTCYSLFSKKISCSDDSDLNLYIGKQKISKRKSVNILVFLVMMI